MNDEHKMKPFHFGHTERGFPVITFQDRYNVECSIQRSSLAFENAVWFGVDEPDPRILIPFRPGLPPEVRGWMPYPLPENVHITTRMHITKEQMQALLPILTHFAQTGELPPLMVLQ